MTSSSSAEARLDRPERVLLDCVELVGEPDPDKPDDRALLLAMLAAVIAAICFS